MVILSLEVPGGRPTARGGRRIRLAHQHGRLSHGAEPDTQQPMKTNGSLREKSASQSWTHAPRPAHHQLPLLRDTTLRIRLSQLPTSTGGVGACPAHQTCFMSPWESEGRKGPYPFLAGEEQPRVSSRWESAKGRREGGRRGCKAKGLKAGEV